MHQSENLDELLICRLSEARRKLEPCTIIIFGASGDLTYRKLIPALYHLFAEGQIPEGTRIVGFARREKSDVSWREELRAALGKFSRTKEAPEQTWQNFASTIFYHQGDLSNESDYQSLKERVAAEVTEDARKNLLFYLAVSPSQFAGTVEQLEKVGLLHKNSPSGWQRIVVEKPFGHDLESARQLNHELTRFAGEKQVYRIDHYLGKETVQNILMFRFSNSIFERLWARETIDHVQITVAEKKGVGTRGGYYEEAGALRDMVQNHLLQVLALIAMEPPVSLAAEAIRDEKVKLLQSIRPMLPEEVARNVVRGQYFAGADDGEVLPGYRQEAKVRSDSNVETFVAMRLQIDNWRWSGVPFYLRTGKRLPQGASEVRIQFRPTPNVLFAAQCGLKLGQNTLTLRLQPNEGIIMRINGKVPGNSVEVRPVRMGFSYDAEFGAYTPEAYERLLMEALAGDATLFIRRDEVETAWAIVDSIKAAWADKPLTNPEFYAAGTWGPEAADALIKRDGRAWHNPEAKQG